MRTNLLASAAVMLAGATVIPTGIERKEAPDLAALLEQHTANVKAALEGFEGKSAEMNAMISEIEQKLARRGGGGGVVLRRRRKRHLGIAVHCGRRRHQGVPSRDVAPRTLPRRYEDRHHGRCWVGRRSGCPRTRCHQSVAATPFDGAEFAPGDQGDVGQRRISSADRPR